MTDKEREETRRKVTASWARNEKMKELEMFKKFLSKAFEKIVVMKIEGPKEP